MTAADYARFEAVLESIQASVNEIAKQQVRLFVCFDRIERRLDRIEYRLEQFLIQSRRSMQLTPKRFRLPIG